MSTDADVASRHLSQVIHVDPDVVYAFASDVHNLPQWAAGLANSSVAIHDDHLVVDSPMGGVTVRFVAVNDFGVLDHDVTLPSGTTVNNPVRVIAHPDGAEVIFTVRQIELTDEGFERDLQTVGEDLARLKACVESRWPAGVRSR
ncbi:SRPBCC family protein [Flexivirga alba]|uniref:SRPBCC family protein n=1 Tax=Flexivirga alba TaxID=702742 RepID=A0ABW2AE57_9MICO